jgi:hypothetical protein
LLCDITQRAKTPRGGEINFKLDGLFRHFGFACAAKIVPKPAALGAAAKRQAQYDKT